MTTTHPQQFWTAGDDWMINATLLRNDGTPFNLTGSVPILWALIDGAGRRALDEDDVGVSITDAVAGRCSIYVPAAKTSPLPGGRYGDFIRINDGGVISTLCYGLIYVTADPWLADEVVYPLAVPTIPQLIYSRPVLRQVA